MGHCKTKIDSHVRHGPNMSVTRGTEGCVISQLISVTKLNISDPGVGHKTKFMALLCVKNIILSVICVTVVWVLRCGVFYIRCTVT